MASKQIVPEYLRDLFLAGKFELMPAWALQALREERANVAIHRTGNTAMDHFRDKIHGNRSDDIAMSMVDYQKRDRARIQTIDKEPK